MTKYLEHGVGKRKSAIARLYLKKGTGSIEVNKLPLDKYFLRPTSRMVVKQPLELTDNLKNFDIHVNVQGGGLSGQAGAIRHAISRALANMEADYRAILKKDGLLTRDSRRKERKLPGQPGARKKYQFSKR